MRAFLLAISMGVPHGDASAADPKVPPAVHIEGREPVAILTAGFDYTRPGIASRLARDGEGEIIAWDVIGNDRFPYAEGGDTELLTALTATLAADAPVSLLAVRIDPADPLSIAKGLAFVARTPAQTVIVPSWSSNREQWTMFETAARQLPHLDLVVRSCPDIPPGEASNVFPRDLDLPNAEPQLKRGLDPVAPLVAYVAPLACRRP